MNCKHTSLSVVGLGRLLYLQPVETEWGLLPSDKASSPTMACPSS